MKTITLILMSFYSVITYGQDALKETKELFKIVNCKEQVDILMLETKKSLIEGTEEVFIKEDVEYNETTVQQFHDFWDKNFPDYSNTLYQRTISAYANTYTKEQVQKNIVLAQNSSENSIFKETGIFDVLKQEFNDYLNYLNSDYNYIIRKIKAGYSQLKLILIINKDTISNPEIDLDLILNMTNDTTISIFNKALYQIETPDSINYDLIKSLSINYLGKVYTIKKYPDHFPVESELTSPLSKACFTDFEHWIIEINETHIKFKSRIEISKPI